MALSAPGGISFSVAGPMAGPAAGPVPEKSVSPLRTVPPLLTTLPVLYLLLPFSRPAAASRLRAYFSRSRSALAAAFAAAFSASLSTPFS